MKRLMPGFWLGSTLVAFLFGYAIGPVKSAAIQGAPAAQGGAAQPAPPAGALPPGDYSRMQLAPDQGEPTLFASADLKKAHTELQARAAKGGQSLSNPRDLMKPMLTRTHSFILMHRPEIKTPTPNPNSEQHEGVTDIYIVMAGGGTVTVGGNIDTKRMSRPGAYTGTISGGKAFKLQAGDVLDIPPNMPHATVPDAGGMTYILMKVNVGLYPWSLINGTP